MNRRGFALIATLWVVAALATAVGLSLTATRLGQQTTLNRIALTRGRWAAEACLALAQARWTQGRLTDTTTVDLGRQTRCAWRTEDPTAKVNVNTVEVNVLRRLGASEPFVRALLDQRHRAPFDDVGQVAALPGADSTLLRFVTVVGPGFVNLSAAPRLVLVAVLGSEAGEAVERVLSRRTLGRPYASLDALIADVSPPTRAVLLERYADLARSATFTAPQLVVTATGWIDGLPLRAMIDVVAVHLPERLAIVRRRMW
jgi:type II secretory pathway component PulK